MSTVGPLSGGEVEEISLFHIRLDLPLHWNYWNIHARNTTPRPRRPRLFLFCKKLAANGPLGKFVFFGRASRVENAGADHHFLEGKVAQLRTLTSFPHGALFFRRLSNLADLVCPLRILRPHPSSLA